MDKLGLLWSSLYLGGVSSQTRRVDCGLDRHHKRFYLAAPTPLGTKRGFSTRSFILLRSPIDSTSHDSTRVLPRRPAVALLSGMSSRQPTTQAAALLGTKTPLALCLCWVRHLSLY